MLVIRFSLILSLATAGYPECREDEKARCFLKIISTQTSAQGKVCVPQMDCEVEGCTEGGSICKRIFKPRCPPPHLIFEGRKISWNSSQVHVQEETAVSEGVDGGSTSDYLLLACLRVTFPIFATFALNNCICICWCTPRKACSTVPVTSCQPCKCSTIYYCTICPPPSPSTPSPPVPPTAPPSPSLPWPAPSENATTTATPIPPPGCF